MNTIKVLIAEDQEIVRSGLEVMLNTREQIEVVGTAKTGLEAVRLTAAVNPDVVLMDIRMPEMDGIQASEIIREKYPDVKILILTTFDDTDYIVSLLKSGVHGYLLKGATIDELEKSIKIVAAGGAIMNSEITAKVIGMFSSVVPNQEHAAHVTDVHSRDIISSTEMKILRLVGTGLSNKEISAKLNLSEGTVRNYISSILDKLGFSNRTQIAIYAMQAGMMSEEL